MHYSQVLACSVVALVNNFAAASEPTFRTWFEAPETVMPGETLQVKLWASFERNGVLVSPSTGYFGGIFGSMEAHGAGALGVGFSPLMPFEDGLLLLGNTPGVPDGNWLRDFAAGQLLNAPGFPPTVFLNPHPLIMFEMTVGDQARGMINIDLRESDFFGGRFGVGWWDLGVGEVLSYDPGVVFLPETGVIRVIPGPASLALLAPLAIVSSRRRRG